MKKIIAFAGLAGCGKDTAAVHIQTHGFTKIAFADTLKDMICCLLNVSRTKLEERDFKEEVNPNFGVSPRVMMQTLGTEWGRNMINQDIWINATRATIERLAGNVVISDVRFPNEVALIKSLGGVVVYINRPGLTAESTHESEVSITPEMCDVVVENNFGTAGGFRQHIGMTYPSLFPEEAYE